MTSVIWGQGSLTYNCHLIDGSPVPRDTQAHVSRDSGVHAVLTDLQRYCCSKLCVGLLLGSCLVPLPLNAGEKVKRGWKQTHFIQLYPRPGMSWGLQGEEPQG